MADWQDLGDGYVRAVGDPSARQVPREWVPPTDRVLPAQPTPAPVAPGEMGTPVAAGALPGRAGEVLSKLDQPAIAAARGQAPQPMGGSQLPIAQQSTTTQSAVPMSVLKPVMDRGMARAESAANATIQAGEQRAQIGEQQAGAAAYAAQGQQAVSLQEAEQAAQRAEIARQNQIAIAAQEDPSIDPDRFIRGMSTGQSIGTVILAAIEGAFRGMTGQAGQSGVLNILERRIDQDLLTQKEQIASGRIRRGNMISYFQQQGMNEEAAEKAAKAMAYAQAEKLTQAEIARIGAGGARAEAAAMAEQIKAAREQANDELLLTLGTPRSSTTTVRQAPGGGDGDSLTKLLAARKAYEESGATPEQLAVFDKANGMGPMAPGGESEVARVRREKSEARTDGEKAASAALSTLDELGTQYGLGRDPAGKGFAEKKDGAVLSKKVGEDIATGFSFGLADNPIEATTAAAIEAFGRMQSGGVIGPEEEQRFRDMISGASTDAQRAIALNSIRKIVESKLHPRDRESRGATSAEAAGFKRVAP